MRQGEALGSLLLPCAATGASLLAVWCLIGATPRGQPWTIAVTLPQGRDGLHARQMAVLWTFREPSLCRYGRREFMRNTLPDLTPNNTRICLPPKKLRRGIHSMIKFFVLDVLLGQVVAVSTDPTPDRAVAPSFFGRPLGQLP